MIKEIRVGLLATIAIALTACQEPSAPDAQEPTPDAGKITVMVSVKGVEIDNAFALRIDGKAPRTIVTGTPFTLDDLPRGSYTLHLEGVPANCTVPGNPRTITIVSGEAASTTFDVLCIATTGAMRITITTTGSDLAAGSITLGKEAIWPDFQRLNLVSPNDSITFNRLSPGDYKLWFHPRTTNCALSNRNPLTVGVKAGEVTSLTLAVRCVELISSAPGTAYTLVTVDGAGLAVPDLWGAGTWDYDGYVYEVTGLTRIIHNDGTYTDSWSHRQFSANSSRSYSQTVRGEYELVDASTIRFGGPNGHTAKITPGGIVDSYYGFTLAFARTPD